MAMRRALLQGLLRRRSGLGTFRSGFNLAASFDSSVAAGPHLKDADHHHHHQVNFSRGYAKKPSKAQKSRSRKEEEEEEEEEDDDEMQEDFDVEEPKRGAKQHMDAAMEALATELSKLRTGRANAGMLDHVEVEIDDKHVSLNKIAAVSVSNSQTLTVMPFDTSTIKKVEAAIRLSPLDLNPQSADQVITVPIPRLTKELSDSMCKLATKAGEDTKKSIRRGRQVAMDQLKKMVSSLSKDELKRHEKEVDELTKQFVKAVDDACKKKETEISKGV